MTYRSQRALIWWALAFAAIYGGALGLLLHMVPPPSAKLDAVQIGHWYAVRHSTILIGAVLASWSSAFMIPLSIVKQVSHSPFPRWFGYLCGWSLVILELGAFAFLAKSGPFAWNGLLVFWIPLPVFGLAVAVLCYLILTSLTKQQAEAALAATVAD